VSHDANKETTPKSLRLASSLGVIVALMVACVLGLSAGPPLFLEILFVLGLVLGLSLIVTFVAAYIKMSRR